MEALICGYEVEKTPEEKDAQLLHAVRQVRTRNTSSNTMLTQKDYVNMRDRYMATELAIRNTLDT
jgi:hypothetical protein